MNILLISPYFEPAVGGVETHLTDLCKYLADRKHRVFVRTYQALGTKNRGSINQRSANLEVHRLPYPDFNLIFKLENYPLLKFGYIFTGLFIDCFVFLLSHARRIDVIQVHGFIAAVIGVVLGKMFGLRVVVNTHVGFKFTENGGLMDRILRLVLLNADEILVLTNNAKEGLVKIGVPADRVKIYHYWVDQKIFRKVTGARQKLGWDQRLKVLFVGRLVAVKGLETIVRLAKAIPEVDFIVVGSGPLAEDLANRSKQIPNFIFIGKISNTDLPTYYSAADLLLVPSQIIKQTYEEGIPRVIIEALSCGLPIMTTPSGGIPDVFSPKIGFMVDDNFKLIEQKIKQIAIDPRLLTQHAKHARVYAEELFSIKNARIIEESLGEG